MQEVVISLIADSLMALLLVVTIFYCFKLNRRIRVLQDSKSEFSRLIERFDAVTQRAQESIAELQNVSQKVDEKLSGKLDKANFLADDLAFMIERGNKVANQAEARIGNAASAKPVSAPAKASASPVRQEQQLSPSTLAAKEKMSASQDKRARRASIEAVMNKISSNRNQANEEKISGLTKGRRGSRTHARLRSRAEQELQEAMKTNG